MSNAAAGFDEPRQQEEGDDGLHPAQHDDLNSKMAMEDGLFSVHQGYPSSKQEMEEGHVDGVHRAQHGHLSSENTMQESCGDGVHMPHHGESNNEEVMEEGFDDGLQGTQHGSLNSEKETQEGYGDGLHKAQQCDLSCEQTMEEGHGDGPSETEMSHEDASSTASVLPQSEKATNAQNPHDSCVHANSTYFGTSTEHHNQCTNLHGEPGAQANLAAWDTSAQHHPETVTSAQDSGDDVDQNIGAHGRPREYSQAAYMASFGTLEEHMHESEAANDTVREHSLKNTFAPGTTEQHACGNVFANDGFNTEGGQSGRFPHNTMFANGDVGEFAQGSACDDSLKNGDFRGNMYDYTSTNYESDANGHEKMTAYDETGGGDFKIDLNENVSSMQAPAFMNSPIKSGSLLPGSSYYTTQSASMKNIGLVLRFGSAIFSLVAFSVIISTKEKRVAAGSTFYVKFSDYQAYNYLAALNLLSFLYSSAQLVLLAQARSNHILSSPVKWGVSIYLCDQMLALLMVSSSSSAATASELSRHGLRNIWPPACSTWKLSFFCSKADVAVAMSFISFLFMLLSSFSSGYHLSNLLAE